MAKANDKKSERVKLITPPFVLSYPNVFVAKANEDDPDSKKKFSCSAIWTPKKFSDGDKTKWLAMKAALDAASRDAFKVAWKDLPANIRRGLRDGMEKADKSGYGEGTKFANLTSLQRPGVIDKNKNAISPAEGNEEEIYPGCICRATVSVFSFGTKKGSKGKGVAFGLNNLQKIADGPRLDNRTAAEDDFDEELESQWLEQEGDEDFGDGDADSKSEAEDDFD